MFAFNFFGFGKTDLDFQTEAVSVVKVENVSKELISSGAGDVLLFTILGASILFAYFVKKFA